MEKRLREIQQQWERYTTIVQQAAENTAEKADRLKAVSMDVIILSIVAGFMLACVAVASVFFWPH
jgi:hypothetical protein